MKAVFELAHEYFKRVFSGNNPLTKKYSVKDFPDINKIVIVDNKKMKEQKK